MDDNINMKDFLQTLGIELNESDYAEFVSSFEKSLMNNVVETITETLDENQLQLLESILANKEESALQTWLVGNVPNLKEIVQDEVDILLGDIAEKSDQL